MDNVSYRSGPPRCPPNRAVCSARVSAGLLFVLVLVLAPCHSRLLVFHLPSLLPCPLSPVTCHHFPLRPGPPGEPPLGPSGAPRPRCCQRPPSPDGMERGWDLLAFVVRASRARAHTVRSAAAPPNPLGPHQTFPTLVMPPLDALQPHTADRLGRAWMRVWMWWGRFGGPIGTGSAPQRIPLLHKQKNSIFSSIVDLCAFLVMRRHAWVV